MKTKYFVILLSIAFAIIAKCAGCPPREIPRGSQTVTIPGLITNVEILGIVADTLTYGTKVNPNKPPPAPWETQFKIPLDSNKLASYQSFTIDSVFLDFRSSSLNPINGSDIELKDGIVQANIVVPDTIKSWNFKEDPVFIVVRGTAVTSSTTTLKGSMFLLPLASMPEIIEIEGEKQINEILYPAPEGEENGFTGKHVDATGNTTNGPKNGTDIIPPE